MFYRASILNFFGIRISLQYYFFYFSILYFLSRHLLSFPLSPLLISPPILLPFFPSLFTFFASPSSPSFFPSFLLLLLLFFLLAFHMFFLLNGMKNLNQINKVPREKVMFFGKISKRL